MVVNNKKQYYIPMETSIEFAKTNGYTTEDFVWHKIGNRSVKVILIPCTEEQYYEYMRPIWRDQKQEERKKQYFEEQGIQQVSVERIRDDYELDIVDVTTLPEAVDKQMLLEELRTLLNQLEELDQQIMTLHLEGYSESAIGKQIGMSQKGVNKRKNNVIKKLTLHFSK